MQTALAILSGGAVGLSLGLIGGGGSILAVPLLFYAVGVATPHEAIGTSSVAVAASALLGLIHHARARTVKWPCAAVFAIFGVAGAAGGASLGKSMDGQKLLLLFGLLMIVVAALMFRRRAGGDVPDVRLDATSASRLLPLLAGAGLLVGGISGFFGIGGGFLIVPGLVGATAMPLLNAIGSSLVSVVAFGTTAAASYAHSGLVDWRIAAFFILGGAAGGLVGARLASRLARHKRMLDRIFAAVVGTVGVYVAARGIAALV